MGTVQGLLDAARSQLGVGEIPPGSNHTPYGDWYVDSGYGGPEFRATAWCDEFVSWCAAQSGNLDAIAGAHAYCPAHVAAFKAAGLWHPGVAGTRAGDVMFANWDGGAVDHVWIVEAVRSDGALVTIEGNTTGPDGHDRVMRRVRSASVVAGYGRPAYDGSMILVDVVTPARPVGQVLPLPQIQHGSRGDAVRQAQRALTLVGPDPRGVDGVFGQRTDAAVRGFQGRYGLAVDGVVGDHTWCGLVQALLIRGGCDPRGVDGVFGPDSTTACLAFQGGHGLEADGIVGPRTWAALLS